MNDESRSRALAELLATPLEKGGREPADREPKAPRPTPWGLLIALMLGAVVMLVGYLVAGGGDATETAVPATTVAPTTVVSAEVGIFPAGYTPVDEAIAAKIVRIGESGDDLAITVTSVAARSVDSTASTPFTGGRWSAVLRNGSTVPAKGQLVDPVTPGVVTALFDPSEVAVDDVVALRISERWFNQETGAIQELEIDGLPWIMDEPEILDLGDGNQLVVEALELSEDGGAVDWSLVGGPAAGVVTLEIALEEGSFDGQPRMVIPIDRVDRFFFDPQTAAAAGRIELSGPTAADGTGIARGFAYWSVRLTVTAPARADIPMPDPGV